VGVLCCLEQWLKEYIKLISINKFKLVISAERQLIVMVLVFILVKHLHT
jgi:hypothetical protein